MTVTIGPVSVAFLIGLSVLLLGGGAATIVISAPSRLFMSFGAFWALLGAAILNIIAWGLA